MNRVNSTNLRQIEGGRVVKQGDSADKGQRLGTWYLGGPSDGNQFRLQFDDPVPTDRDIGDIRFSSIVYVTDDPWPETL